MHPIAPIGLFDRRSIFIVREDYPLSKEIMNAVMDALAAHTTMSKQAIGSERVREGLKDVLLGPAQLYEALRDKGDEQGLGGA
jgi:hypothetical protein